MSPLAKRHARPASPVNPVSRSLPALLRGGLVSALLAFSLPAQAALHVVHTNHSDGTESFDPQDGPGMDSSANNDIVRTHDTFQYRVSISSDGGERQVRIRLTLPPPGPGQASVQWSYLPNECQQPGSSLGDGNRSVDCLLGDFNASGTSSYYFQAKVMGSSRHGDRIAPPQLQVSSAGTQALPHVEQTRPLTVSAAPFYDVRLHRPGRNAAGISSNSGPEGEDGFYHRLLIGLLARHPQRGDNRGVEQLDPTRPVEIELDIS